MQLNHIDISKKGYKIYLDGRHVPDCKFADTEECHVIVERTSDVVYDHWKLDAEFNRLNKGFLKIHGNVEYEKI